MGVVSPKTDWLADLLARALAVVCALNVNGVVSMMADIGQVVSIPLLVFSLVLIAKTGRYANSTALLLLFAAIVSYLVLATLLYRPDLPVRPLDRYYRTYISSLALIWAVCGYVGSLPPGPRLRSFLAFVRNCFVVSAIAVLGSSLIYPYFVHLPPSAMHRMGGFFGNPNEAAAASLYAIALLLAVPFRNILLQWLAVAVAALATLLTFSKAGIITLVLLCIWHLLRLARGSYLAVTAIVSTVLMLMVVDLHAVAISVIESPVLQLDLVQRERLTEAANILSGQVDAESSTGRTKLWLLTLSNAWADFPLGSGIGSAHNIVDGVFENGAWMGSHNTVLMILGEAGLLPALLAVAALVLIAYHAVFRALGDLERYAFFVLFVELMVNHTTLGSRYANLILGIILGLVASRNRLPWPRRRHSPGHYDAAFLAQPVTHLPR